MVRKLERCGVNEIACLIDFGVEPAQVLESLELIAGLGRSNSQIQDETLLSLKSNNLIKFSPRSDTVCQLLLID